VQRLYAHQVRPQGLPQACRQHRNAVLPALAVADRDLLIIEIHVLDPELEAFAQPQTRSVQQTGHQPLRPVQAPKECPHLLDRQYHRHAHRALGTLDLVHPWQLQLEHRAVEKQQR